MPLADKKSCRVEDRKILHGNSVRSETSASFVSMENWWKTTITFTVALQVAAQAGYGGCQRTVDGRGSGKGSLRLGHQIVEIVTHRN